MRSCSTVDINNFFDSLGCPAHLKQKLDSSIKIFNQKSKLNCTSSPVSVMKVMLICLLNDDYSDEYLKLFAKSSTRIKNYDDLITLFKMNMLAMFRESVSSKNFIKIFAQFVSTFVNKFAQERLDLVLFWVLETVANERRNNPDFDSLKFNYIMKFIELEVIPQYGPFNSDVLSPSWKVTYTSFRIEYYLESDDIDKIYLILSDKGVSLSGEDLVFISESAISANHLNILSVLFHENMDYSYLLSSNFILNEAGDNLKLHLPRISEMKLNPSVFKVSAANWDILKEILTHKASIEEILGYFLREKLYFQVGIAFQYIASCNLDIVANELLKDFENPEMIYRNIFMTVLPLVDVDVCHLIRQLLLRLIIEEQINLMVLGILSNLTPAYETERIIVKLVRVTGSLVVIFDLAARMKAYSALSILCIFFRIESSGDLIRYNPELKRYLGFLNDVLFLMDENGDQFEIFL